MLFKNKPSTEVFLIKVTEGSGAGNLWFKQVCDEERGGYMLDLQSGRENGVLLFGRELADSCREMVESQIEKVEGDVVSVEVEHVGSLVLFDRVLFKEDDNNGKPAPVCVPDTGGGMAPAHAMLAAKSSLAD